MNVFEYIKKNINLIEYMSSFGYKKDVRKSSRQSICMRKNDDKLIVKKDYDLHWVYCNVKNDIDCGSIIDFEKNRHSANVSESVTAILSWFGCRSDIDVDTWKAVDIKPVKRNRNLIVDQIGSMPLLEKSVYLNQRGVSDTSILDARFFGTLREGEYGNVVFPHLDVDGYCGYESKNYSFQGFSKGGIKSIWTSNKLKGDKEVMLVESGIDGVSHYALYAPLNRYYISTGGSPSPEAIAMVCKVCKNEMKNGLNIISGFDNDIEGDKLHDKICSEINEKLDREKSSKKDWNEDLKNSLI